MSSCIETADDHGPNQLYMRLGLATFCGSHENMASPQSSLCPQSHPGTQDRSAIAQLNNGKRYILCRYSGIVATIGEQKNCCFIEGWPFLKGTKRVYLRHTVQSVSLYQGQPFQGVPLYATRVCTLVLPGWFTQAHRFNCSAVLVVHCRPLVNHNVSLCGTRTLVVFKACKASTGIFFRLFGSVPWGMAITLGTLLDTLSSALDVGWVTCQ